MNDFLYDFCSIGISFETDRFRLLYFAVTTFVFLMCTVFCREYMNGAHSKARFYTFWALTYGAVCGVLFSGDFFTLLMFFEIMSVTSSFWVLHEENEESDYAGRLYLRISIACGLVMLFGIVILYHVFGTLGFSEIRLIMAQGNGFDEAPLKAAAFMMFVGFGAKAGVFLLHIWLPKAHTAAPAPASAVLSGILTKTGIIGIILTSSVLGLISDESWGRFLLIAGVCTMFTGAFLAIFSINLKRTLACSSVSQIGFIVTGIACMVLSGGTFEYSGTLLHMLNHSGIKLILFLIVGGVLKKTGSLDLNAVRGYGKNKPWLMIPFAVGALSISGVPGFSGYVSKTLIHESIEMLPHSTLTEAANIIFTVTGGMTLCYMLKLFVCLFVEDGRAKHAKPLNVLSTTVVTLSALPVFLAGVLPKEFAKIPKQAQISEYVSVMKSTEGFAEVAEMSWFSWHTMKGGLISISIGIVLYFLVVRLLLIRKKAGKRVYINALPFWFDLEKYVYRPVFLVILPFICALFFRILDKSTDFIAYFLKTNVFSAVRKKRKDKVGKNGITYVLGTVLDFFTRNKYHDEKKSFTDRLAVVAAETGEMARNLERSLSLSMLMFSVGLLITLIIMLIKIS